MGLIDPETPAVLNSTSGLRLLVKTECYASVESKKYIHEPVFLSLKKIELKR